MTPSKEKKALPISNAAVFPEQPTDYSEWKTALQQIKVLYLKRQYKHCASRCTQLLSDSDGKIHPLHATFLNFYAALSYEITARSTHILSAAKLPTLHLAKESYQAAATSLPQPEYLSTDDRDHEDDEEEEGSSISFSDTASLNSASVSSDETDSPTSYANSATSPSPSPSPSPSSSSPSPSRTHSPTRTLPRYPSSTYTSSTSVAKPSPLRIRKKEVHFTPSPSSSSLLPRCHTITSLADSHRSRLSSPTLTFAPQTSTFLHTRSLYRYNLYLNSLFSMLQSHIYTVDNLIQSTAAAQAGRYQQQQQHESLNGTGTGMGDTEFGKEAEGRKERIALLKARNWNRRARFVPGRYEELCNRALADL